MIFIQAKIKCEHSGCEASADIEIELCQGAQGIPVLSPDSLPEGWALQKEYGFGYGISKIHVCPEHSKEK